MEEKSSRQDALPYMLVLEFQNTMALYVLQVTTFHYYHIYQCFYQNVFMVRLQYLVGRNCGI